MHCPFCRNPDSRVVDSRETDEGQAIRRRRSCPECGRRFTTVETAVLAVVKRSGVTETVQPREGDQRCAPGVSGPSGRRRRAQLTGSAGRGHRKSWWVAGNSSHEVGLAILGPLRELDEVAYLRFASVYRSFSSADDFEREIKALRAHRKVPASG